MEKTSVKHAKLHGLNANQMNLVKTVVVVDVEGEKNSVMVANIFKQICIKKKKNENLYKERNTLSQNNQTNMEACLLTQIHGVVFVIQQTKGGKDCHPFMMILENQKQNGFETLTKIADVFEGSYINTENCVLYMPKQDCIITTTPFKDTMVVEYTIMPMQSKQGQFFLQKQ